MSRSFNNVQLWMHLIQVACATTCVAGRSICVVESRASTRVPMKSRTELTCVATLRGCTSKYVTQLLDLLVPPYTVATSVIGFSRCCAISASMTADISFHVLGLRETYRDAAPVGIRTLRGSL